LVRENGLGRESVTSLYLPGSLQRLLGSVSGEAGGNNTSKLDSLGADDLTVDTGDALRTIDQDLRK
jgi:hypothetical protein